VREREVGSPGEHYGYSGGGDGSQEAKLPIHQVVDPATEMVYLAIDSLESPTYILLQRGKASVYLLEASHNASHTFFQR
jgi:hypothetical protein